MAYLRHCIDAAQTLGQARARPALQRGRPDLAADARRAKRDIDLLVRQLSELSSYAQSHGVGICVEPLNRFETSFLNLAEQAIEVVDRVDHPACKVLLDTFHMNIEERSIGDAIRAAGKRVRQSAHVRERSRRAGLGTRPWTEVAQAIRDIKFDGPLVIESFTPKVKSIARAAAIWRPLAKTPDALATEGLAFLRKLL